ncbi:ectonucleotide pyrophosphatase/phosphodiesterase [Balneolales bacterium ANBcel1]|nr:ectonucleotide pyrophosphatase/phosphodiesterase [Balneolales bacterium ANBcel1]
MKKRVLAAALAILISYIPVHAETNPVILISVDGFMPEYLERTETPNFDALAGSGVLADYLIPVFPTLTFTNHYSIVTGLYPENHGILSNSMYDPEWEATFSLGNRDEIVKGRWYEGEPLWVTAENQGMRTASMFWVGSEAEIAGVRPTRWNSYDSSLPHQQRIDSVITWLTLEDESRPDFITLYFSRLDSRGHSHGPHSIEVTEAIADMDDDMGYLIAELERSGLRETTNIVIVSDHGMAATSDDKVIFLDEIIDLDDVRVIGWGPVSMIRPDEGKTEEVYRLLKEAESHYRVYYRDELPDEYRIGNHRRTPEIIMVAELPWSITSRSFFERRGLLAGNHGWDHREPEMRTFFLADGPDFKSGMQVEAFELIHIYEMICHILGLDPAENDGSLEAVRHMLAE